MQKYAGKPVSELIGYMTSKMPPGNPGSLGAPAYTQIAAFILQQNGAPARALLNCRPMLPSLSRLIFPGAVAAAWSWARCGTRRRTDSGR